MPSGAVSGCPQFGRPLISCVQVLRLRCRLPYHRRRQGFLLRQVLRLLPAPLAADTNFYHPLMGLAFPYLSCASAWDISRWQRSAAFPLRSWARWRARHAGGTVHCCKGLSSCRASRPWSWRLMSGPARYDGAGAAVPRALLVPPECYLLPTWFEPPCRTFRPSFFEVNTVDL